VTNGGVLHVPAIRGSNNDGLRNLTVKYLCPQFLS
jgi:hypothetical protein